MKPCNNDLQDCYVVDNNGYVVLSERQNDTGRFFGEVEGAIMESLTESGIFKMLTIYDFQALCSLVREVESNSDMILTVSSTITNTSSQNYAEFSVSLFE